MDLPRVLAFGAVALVVIVIPGPSVLFIVSRAVALGRRGALITVVGNALGELLQVLVVALGMGPLLERSALVFAVVELLGAAYLCYLGVAAWRARRRSTARLAEGERVPGDWRTLRQGFLVGVTNPKSMVFFAAVLPEFVARQLGHVQLQLLVLGLTWVAIALVCDSTLALLADGAQASLLRHPRRLERASGASAAVMVGLGVGLALTSRAS